MTNRESEGSSPSHAIHFLRGVLAQQAEAAGGQQQTEIIAPSSVFQRLSRVKCQSRFLLDEGSSPSFRSILWK